MNYIQYEEFCRLFVATSLRIPVERVQSRHMASATRPGLHEYVNQIDLCWETDDDLTRHIHIADVKLRTSEKVDQGDVLQLQQVRQEVSAHKAVLITSTGFTAGARAAAEQHQIALHIVRPIVSSALLPADGRTAIMNRLTQLHASSPGSLYHHEVVCRGLWSEGAGTSRIQSSPPTSVQVCHTQASPPPLTTAVVNTVRKSLESSYHVQKTGAPQRTRSGRR